MTDNEIIKAFEVCYTSAEEGCDNCPYLDEYGFCTDSEESRLHHEVADLLIRQKAEIERLQIYSENLKISENHLLNECATVRKKAKSEAIKEFAERLKGKYEKHFNDSYKLIYDNQGRNAYRLIDNLVKEMEEEIHNGR